MSINRIENQYKFTKEELDIIKNNFTCHTDWDKVCFADLKKAIIIFLRKEQDNKCCYCKKELGFDLKQVDIEHILPKSTFSNFTFHVKNLALSCPGCNTKKSNVYSDSEIPSARSNRPSDTIELTHLNER